MNSIKRILLLALCIVCMEKVHAQSEGVFYTSMGSFNFILTDSITRVTVDSFINRATRKFYDGLTFHRVIDSFMIQGGDPDGTGFGGTGTLIPDEFSPKLKHIPGTFGMANIGKPNTGDCQFFINVWTNSHLNNKHTVFGNVTANYPVVESIAKVPRDANDKPLTTVYIDSIRITKLYVFPASVDKTNNRLSVVMYPNPCRGSVNIEMSRTTSTVEIINMSGQAVYKKEAKGTLTVDVSAMQAGLYIVHVTNANGKYNGRLIVQ